MKLIELHRYLLKPGKRASRQQSAMFAGLFAIAGVAVIWATFAATTPIAFETESGTLAAGATTTTTSGASGGSAIKFAAVATPTPTATPSGGKPDATNTGVPASTSLTVVTGNQTYGSSFNGQTITGKDFRGYVRVTGTNITFTNCIFRGGTPSGNNALLDTQTGSASGIVVQDSEFVPTTPAATIDGIYAENITLLRVNVHGTVDGVKASNNTTIQDSYVHDMSYFASDPNQGGGETHNDAVQILDGTNIHLIHNTLAAAGTSPNSAVQITQDFGAVSAVTIANNWVDYGGCTLNIAHKGGTSLTGISITGNRFGRHQGFSGCTVLLSTKTTLSAYSGNVWDDTGLAVPSPQVHD